MHVNVIKERWILGIFDISYAKLSNKSFAVCFNKW